MKKCNVNYFVNDKGELMWKCPQNMGPQTPRKVSATKCWKYNCPGVKSPDPNMFCNYELCNNLSISNSKYCSEVCRKRKHRRDYKIRKSSEWIINT